MNQPKVERPLSLKPKVKGLFVGGLTTSFKVVALAAQKELDTIESSLKDYV